MAGSTTNLLDRAGNAVVSYDYSDFGETTVYGDADFYNEICYNGAASEIAKKYLKIILIKKIE